MQVLKNVIISMPSILNTGNCFINNNYYYDSSGAGKILTN